MSTPSFGKRRNHVRRTDRSSRRQGGRPHPPTTRAVASIHLQRRLTQSSRGLSAVALNAARRSGARPFRRRSLSVGPLQKNFRGGGGRTRTYEGLASGFTVRPLCRSGHSPRSRRVLKTPERAGQVPLCRFPYHFKTISAPRSSALRRLSSHKARCAARPSRACPTSDQKMCRNRQQPISMRP